MPNNRDESVKAETKESNFQIKAPSINLPKGGGAIRGIGEKFAANPVTGTGSMSVPIATSPGRSGFGPQLSLSYDSGSGNGPFGFGWSLSLPAITRKTDKGLPKYQDAEESDVFILSGSEDLVPVVNPDGSRSEDTSSAADYIIHRYRPRIEGLFARIERWTHKRNGDVHWRSISKDNILTLYGKDANSRIADPEHPSHVFSWLICETRDDKGNAIVYEYKEEDGAGIKLNQVHERNRGAPDDIRRTANRYIKYIHYGNRSTLLDNAGHRPRFLTREQINNTDWMFEVVFDYDEHDTNTPKPDDAGEWTFREDAFSSYRSGFEVRTTRLCQRVLMFHHIPDVSANDKGYDGLVRSTDFTYSHEQEPTSVRNPVYTFLRAVKQIGYRRKNGGYVKRSLPPLEFKYSQPEVQDKVEQVEPASLENLPIGVDGTTYQWTDLHGEGIPGILTEQADTWFYKRNYSPINKHKKIEFTPMERVSSKPNVALAEGAQFMDLAGDGQPDVVMLDEPTPGFYEHDGDLGWQSFRPFINSLNRDMRDSNLKFIDLDGDGHADVLISEDDAFVWHASLAETGFGPARRVAQALDEDKGPRLIFADGTQSIYLADLSGDGLTDLVRIRNGEVCYWPNLGYCRFGAKITMDQSPHFDSPDQFDQKRIRLADIDGTGTTDIIYIRGDGVYLYFNQSGNSWSKAKKLKVFPRVDDVVSITTADLLGNSTACLVWSSPLPGDTQQLMRYVNLMGKQKPHLLIKTINNLGAETHVHYAPSTKFYLKDKRDGKPWITRLPFPVHVVERVETYDHISRNRFVSRYAYHHGYFDGHEREFRGFGMVEQWDTEDIATLSASDPLAPVGGESWGEGVSNLKPFSHVPPVHTKTWFHTGAYLGRGHISDYFEKEYFREPGLNDQEARELLLPDTILPGYLTIDEEREACPALKGQMLRQEVYADDKTTKAQYPYTVTEQNFTIKRLQDKASNPHAVFFTHARETINYHYEREPSDPRIQHAMTLEVDNYGNVRKSLAIGYGRRSGKSPLTGKDKDKQEQTLITYTESDITNAINLNPGEAGYDPAIHRDNYRTPLASEVRTYELTGFAPDNGAKRFSFEEVTLNNYEKIRILSLVPYETETNYTVKRKRLIEHVRTLYRKNNLTGFSPPGEVEFLALPGETYKLAFTSGLAKQIYVDSGKATQNDLNTFLANDGGYVDLDSDGHWWIPSGRVYYKEDADVTDPASTAASEFTEARQHFFLPRKYTDPFLHSTRVRYDSHDLLLQETIDAVNNIVTVGERNVDDTLASNGNNYRTLQAEKTMGPNRNRSVVAFDALGLVVGTAVMGKPEDVPQQGDLIDAAFTRDPTRQQLDDFENDPLGDPAYDLLAKATSRVVYDIHRFYRSRKAAPDNPEQWQAGYAATIARETHVSDLPVADSREFKIQVSFSYSDGFGHEIQKKIQAERGPVDGLGDDVNPRWVGSGWIIFNNKGKPVRQYEPFFSTLPDHRHRFEFARKQGVSPILFYDPLQRVVVTLHPNHSYEKVVFDPWRQTMFDVNDTCAARNTETGDPRTDPDIKGYVEEYFKALPVDPAQPWQTWYQQRIGGAPNQPEYVAANKAAAHADTPTTAHFDSLGRPFLTTTHNRTVCANHPQDGADDQFATRVELDIEGNQRQVKDERKLPGGTLEQRIVMHFAYDMLSNRIYQTSMEAGARWLLNDVTASPIRAWDSRGFLRRMPHDQLRRPVGLFVTENGTERLAEETIYGEGQGDASNHRTRVHQVRDGAGVVTSAAYDFKGNLLESQRDLLPYDLTPDWQQNPVANDGSFISSTTYDALNRPVTSKSPDGSVYRPTYNDANLLDKVEVTLPGAAAAIPFVKNINYDTKGQRKLIEYGSGAGAAQSGVTTAYDYDPYTFRLINLKTTRPAGLNGVASKIFNDNKVVQNLFYTYDPAGNITQIEDKALKSIAYNNEQIDPVSKYTYDAMYRLIKAEGRAHISQSGFDFTPNGNYRDFPFTGHSANPNDLQALRNYSEIYDYDAVGNFNTFKHVAKNGTWTRSYEYKEASLIEAGKMSNRLTRAVLGNGQNYTENFRYDEHGNMTRMQHFFDHPDPAKNNMDWDFEDQLSQIELAGGGKAHYIYDASGQRVRKVIVSQSGKRQKERIYLGNYEVYREYKSNGVDKELERQSLHVMDDKQRFALVETRTKGIEPEIPKQLIRFQLGNHLGSASLELADNGELISYEEYRPYGCTAFQAGRSGAEVSLKRYRYSGKERDEESGLYYYGARYCSPWLGTWTTVDPAGIVDGPNLYSYTRNNPIRYTDPTGNDSHESGATKFFRGLWTGGKSLYISTLKQKLESLKKVVSDPVRLIPALSQGPVGVMIAVSQVETEETVKKIVADTEQFGGGARGAAYAVNENLNPAVGLLKSTYLVGTAVQSGDWESAGEQTPQLVLDAVSTVGTAVGVAKGLRARSSQGKLEAEYSKLKREAKLADEIDAAVDSAIAESEMLTNRPKKIAAEKVNVGGEGEEVGYTNLNPMPPYRGSSMHIPKLIQQPFEKIAEFIKSNSVSELISNKLRFVDVTDWSAAAKGAHEVMKPGGTLSMNIWASAEQAKLLVRAFTEAGFKDVKISGEGVSTMLTGTR
jgi:RHS repeat-associated protein